MVWIMNGIERTVEERQCQIKISPKILRLLTGVENEIKGSSELGLEYTRIFLVGLYDDLVLKHKD